MKAFLLGLVFLALLSVGGYIGLKYYYKSPTGQTAVITKTGTLRKSTISQSDFTHVIVISGGSLGVASYTLNLDEYIGKKVSVTGKFSGDTLFADSITIIP